MIKYYIELPKEPEDRKRLTNLLSGLEAYSFAGLKIRQCLQVTVQSGELDPILNSLAMDKSLSGEPDPEPQKKNGGPPAKKAVKQSPLKGRAKKIYEVVGTGEKLDKNEMAKALRDRKFDVSTKVRHSSKGIMVVISGLRGHELSELKNGGHDF